MPSPSISVVIPLYNKGAYIADAIRSVLIQAVPVLEVLVVDDGSTDDGPAQVAAMRQPQIRLLTQPNAGVSAARNRGIAQARGDLVAFLDADDLWQPGFLDAITALYRQCPDAKLYGTGYTRVDPQGHREDVQLQRLASEASGAVADFYRAWSAGSFTFTSAIAVPRATLLALTPAFPVGERLGEDQDLWFRLAERGTVAYCNRPLVDYRVGVAGSATQTCAVQAVLPCFQRLSARLAAGLVPPAMRAGARRLLASHCLNVARGQARAGHASQAWQQLLHPWSRGNPLYWLRTLLWLAAHRHPAPEKT